jgi:hypothetical protein
MLITAGQQVRVAQVHHHPLLDQQLHMQGVVGVVLDYQAVVQVGQVAQVEAVLAGQIKAQELMERQTPEEEAEVRRAFHLVYWAEQVVQE